MSGNNTNNTNLKKHLLVFLKGMAMGAADSVPGVSGGTIAVIARIYDELINSIRSINIKALRLLFSDGVGCAWAAINGTFLLVLLCGIIVSLRLSAGVVLVLLDSYFEAMMAFFIGLVIASCWFLRTEFGNWSFSTLLALLGGICLTLLVSSISPQSASISYWYLFACGMVAICAMILPGLSGAFLLLMLGVYDFLLSALVELELLSIFVFMLGCVSGLMLFSRVLAWTLGHFRELSYAFLTGMLVASIYVLWPWQRALSFYTDSDGEAHVLERVNILPGSYMAQTGLEPRILLVVISLLAGVALIVGFDKLFRQPAD